MKIQDLLDPEFRGSICITRKGEVLYSRTTGFADLVNRIPNRENTRYASASAGKTFVAVGILQLIAAGKLDFQDTLGELLPFDLGTIDRAVTVEQLLTHTSGVPDYFDENVMEEYDALWTDFPNYKIRKNNDLLPLFRNKPMLYPRGTRFQYNNSGYVLLASVIEAVTGMEFDAYLKEHVFAPCGMEDTGYFELDRLPERCANSYIFCPETGEYRTNIYSVDAKGTGAGGAFITVPDILRFWEGLLGGRLLPDHLVEAMMRKQSGDGSDPEEGWYGYGLWILDNPTGRDRVYFQGADPGVSFLSEYDPDTGTLSVLVSNYRDKVFRLMRRLRPYLYNK